MSLFTEQLDKIVSTFKTVVQPLTSPKTNSYLTSNPNDNPAAFGPNMTSGVVPKSAPHYADNTKTGIAINTIAGIPQAAADTAKNIGQSVARSVASAGTTFGNIPSQITHTPAPFAPSIPTTDNKFTSALFGGKPVETVQERIKNLQPQLSPYIGQQGAKYSAAPLVLGGILMDLSGFGGGKVVDVASHEVPEAFLKLLAKKSDPVVLENTLRAVKVDEANAKALASKLKDANTIDKVKDILIAHEPVTTTPTIFQKPKVQISEEGIPMARKEVPFMPKLTSTKTPVPKLLAVPEVPAPTGMFGLLKRDLSPLKYVDADTASVLRKWNAANITAKELANQTASSLKIPGDGMDLINRYQQGEPVPQVKEVFDALFNEAKSKGIDVPYRQNYVPQVYKESYPKIQQTIAKYLTDNGVTDEQAKDYIKGINPLPTEVANRLKVTPSFEKERVFDSYKTAEEYGLHPKYNTIAELAAHYRGELEKVVANKKLFEELKSKRVLRPADSEFTPKDWVVVNSEFSGPKLYKASPNVAKAINNIFPNPANRGLLGTAVKNLGEASSIAQNIVLSAGAPGTNVNFFAIGQLVKELTSGNVKAAKAFLQTNNKSSTIKYFNANKDTLLKMANQGIDVTNRMGSFNKESFMGLVKDKQIVKALGLGIDKVFGEKTFQGFIPMMEVQLFKSIFNSAVRKGLPSTEAEVLAGDILKKNFGINANDFVRSAITKDTLKAGLFAPRFREGVIGSLGNTGKAGIDLAYHLGGARGKIDPTLSRNRRLLVGMILTFAAYNALNKKINGYYMWDNPENRKFALRIPLPNGDVTYVEFMPSYLAFGRNMASGVVSAATGDFKSATQQFGSIFSIPIKVTSEVLSNRDYFGTPIYKETDSTGEKLKKVGVYLGLGTTHPYVKELVNQIQDKKPLYQSIMTGLELPLKFSNKDKEEANKIFKVIDQQNKDRADMTKLSEKEYNRLKALPGKEANTALAEIYKTNPDLYEKIKDRAEADKMGLSDNERYIKMLDIDHRAQYIFQKLSEMSTGKEKNDYIADLARKKIVTKDTYVELVKLINKK